MVLGIIGGVIQFMINTTLYIGTIGLIATGIAIYTKPDINSFDNNYDQYIRVKTQKHISSSNIVSNVASSVSRLALNVEHKDYILIRTAKITRPENGPLFIGALNQWFCIQDNN